MTCLVFRLCTENRAALKQRMQRDRLSPWVVHICTLPTAWLWKLDQMVCMMGQQTNHMHAWSYCSYTHTWTCTTYMYVFSGRTPHPFEQRKVVFHVFRHGLNLFAFKFAALSIEKKQRKSLKLDKNDDKLFISLHGKRKVWWKCFLVNKI